MFLPRFFTHFNSKPKPKHKWAKKKHTVFSLYQWFCCCCLFCRVFWKIHNRKCCLFQRTPRLKRDFNLTLRCIPLYLSLFTDCVFSMNRFTHWITQMFHSLNWSGKRHYYCVWVRARFDIILFVFLLFNLRLTSTI